MLFYDEFLDSKSIVSLDTDKVHSRWKLADIELRVDSPHPRPLPHTVEGRRYHQFSVQIKNFNPCVLNLELEICLEFGACNLEFPIRGIGIDFKP